MTAAIKQNDKPVYAAIYARYSAHSQTEQSIEGQLSKGHAYAEARGYTVVREYIDRAMTGRNDDREGFQRMLSDTAKRQFQVIIVWKVDRFGRNREEIAFNKHICKKNGVRVEYVAESVPDTPEGVILESVLEGMAEYYSIQLSQNVRRGMFESAKKCQSIGGTKPLGYTVDPKTKQFCPDPKTAPIVQNIFEWYANGMTISEIVRELNKIGLKTTRGGPFTKSSLTHLLKNEKYIGVYSYKKDVRVENGMPALIDKDTFDAVQDLLKLNRRAPSHKWSHIEYILTGKIFCGNCCSSMVGKSGFSQNSNKYGYYVCTKRLRERTCTKKHVRQDWIERLVLAETLQMLHDDALLERIVDVTWQVYEESNELDEKRAALEAQLREVEKGQANLVRAIEAGIFNAATKNRMDELDAQKTALQRSLAELQIESEEQITRQDIADFLHGLRDMSLHDDECQKRLVQTFINAVYVYDDKIRVVYNFRGGERILLDGNRPDSTTAAELFACCAKRPTKGKILVNQGFFFFIPFLFTTVCKTGHVAKNNTIDALTALFLRQQQMNRVRPTLQFRTSRLLILTPDGFRILDRRIAKHSVILP